MAGARSERLTRLRHDPRPFLLGCNADAELFGFLEFRASPRPSNNQISLRADRSRGARTEALGLGFGFVAAHGFEAAGEDDRLAAPFGLPGVADKRLGRDFRQQII